MYDARFFKFAATKYLCEKLHDICAIIAAQIASEAPRFGPIDLRVYQITLCVCLNKIPKRCAI